MESPNKEIMLRLIQASYRENLLLHHIEGSQLILSLPRLSDHIVVSGCQFGTLGRLLDIQSVKTNKDNVDIHDYQEFLSLLKAESGNRFEAKYWNQLLDELSNNEHNLALNENIKYVRITQTKSYHHLLDFVHRHHSDNPSLYFEQFAQSGHPYHPCHKTKLGFSEQDLKKYSAEFSPIVQVYLTAIKTDAIHLENTTPEKIKQFFKFHWPQAFSQWLDALPNSHEYTPLLIHPWQYKNLSESLTNNEMLRVFNHITVTSQPTLSFRTMDIKTEHGHVYCKLPVAIQATSAVRTVSPASVHNGPKISTILLNILQKEPEINSVLRILKETFGCHLKHPDDAIAKQISMIMRDHANTVTNDNETAIVIAALFELTPTTQLPLIFELLSTKLDDIWTFLAEYFSKAIEAFLSPFLLYGIALECHQQNTLLILKNHLPHGFIIRDYGGVRIYRKQLAKRGFNINAHPNSATICDNRVEVRNKLIHCLYQIHFGEIILLFDKYLNIRAEKSWQIMRAMTEKCFLALKNRIPAKQWQEDFDAILNLDWDFKCLLSMRLTNDYSEYTYATIKNPMAQPQLSKTNVKQPLKEGELWMA